MELYILTGATGFLGSEILKRLVKDKKHVKAIIRNKNKIEINSKYVNYIYGDIRDKKALEKLFKGNEKYNKIYVIHAASLITLRKKVNDKIYNTNVIGTKNIINLSEKYKVDKFIYISSTDVLPVSNKPISEKDFNLNVKPKGAYAKTKGIATEMVIKSKLNYVILMPSAITGPTSRNTATNRLIKNIINGLPFLVNAYYDFVDVRDVAGLSITLCTKNTKSKIFIISNKTISFKELVKEINKFHKTRVLYYFNVNILYLAIPFSYLISLFNKKEPLVTKVTIKTIKNKVNFDNSLVKKEVGFKPTPLDISIKDIINNLD